uniref:Secreted protein n=1 Tax=Pyxicephalus adspersus TaxID=30357 RepID=A0AAV3A310_PYXAD|nr:TPA: hypothetical protein GDO54_017531 [Pyxicephalus adspersus]
MIQLYFCKILLKNTVTSFCVFLIYTIWLPFTIRGHLHPGRSFNREGEMKRVLVSCFISAIPVAKHPIRIPISAQLIWSLQTQMMLSVFPN